jgi:glyoxalase/bleomycin resistance protein/dioxygenase superfamily protein
MTWIQVRDVHAEHARLAAAGVPVVREPAAEPWGLTEMQTEDPDGIRIVLVEVPADHPLRLTRDSALLGSEPPCGRWLLPRSGYRPTKPSIDEGR